ncbi:aspartate kinase [Eisenibacter elegans]|uniref:aspartate kinase n=1 Tax=Eisenibacter elegans TaxID=997 RepID=UPI000407CB97|nr:aspartate kinase [Eisenibacter elegans]
MELKIFKFGGASVESPARVRNVVQLVATHFQTNSPNPKLVIVVSAMGKMTNAFEVLLEACWHNKPTQEAWQHIYQYHQGQAEALFTSSEGIHSQLAHYYREIQALAADIHQYQVYDQAYDALVSYGELLSTTMLAAALQQAGLPVVWMDARQLIRTDHTWREGKVIWDTTQAQICAALTPPLTEGHLVLTQGFLGGTPDGHTTTLGREGSDFTGAILAHCLDAQSLTIWKDVPGVLNADPKRVAHTTLYERLSYRESAEMSTYGASVIHPKTIKPLVEKQIPLFVRSFINPEAAGTRIAEEPSDKQVPNIIFKDNQVVIHIQSDSFALMNSKLLSTILQACEEANLAVNFIQTFATQLAIATNPHQSRLEQVQVLLQKAGFTVKCTTGLQLITLQRYNDDTLSTILAGRKPYLLQRSEALCQLLV